MPEKFYEQGDEFLRIKGGIPSKMVYALHISNPTTGSHYLYGDLRQVKNQLVVDLAPQIGPGSYVQIRQKMDKEDIISVEVVVPNDKGNKHIKNSEWHYQPMNKKQFYYTNFSIDSVPIQLVIGSNVSQNELLEYFKGKVLPGPGVFIDS
ncbi:MAG: hypothetical protein IIA87_05265 [Nanoarchaeota archaeon]|nr:hypothetical protein [Nanoarchaeota archaeon]